MRLFAVLVLLAGAALASGAAPDLRDLLWTDPAADRARALTHPPAECLKLPASPEIEAGRALFRSRMLLGGPAARVGLSCESCHTAGRTNPHFLLPELTNAPGAADVTSEWSSKIRGDGILNPKPIPDLLDVGGRKTFGSNADPSLDHFVDSVIEEEFQGAPPPSGARVALIAYLKALKSSDCPAQAAPVSIHSLIADVRRAVLAAASMAARGDAATADVTLLAAQDAVARLAEHLPADGFSADRSALADLARDLGRLRAEAPLRETLPIASSAWIVRFDAAARRIEKRQSQTYANEMVLRAALAAEPAPR